MEETGILPQHAVDVLALVLLAVVEMGMLGIFVQFYGTTELGGNAYFVFSTFALSFFSMLILGISSLRAHSLYGCLSVRAIKAGARVGLVSAAGICLAAAVFSVFGMGPERLVPAMAASWGTDRLGVYAVIFAGLAVSYSMAGAFLGALAWVPKKLLSLGLS